MQEHQYVNTTFECLSGHNVESFAQRSWAAVILGLITEGIKATSFYLKADPLFY